VIEDDWLPDPPPEPAVPLWTIRLSTVAGYVGFAAALHQGGTSAEEIVALFVGAVFALTIIFTVGWVSRGRRRGR
jgi:hypothetical protein